VASKYAGKLKVVKCNVDENPELATQYGVVSIPNLIFFKDGQIVNQVVGYKNEQQLSSVVEEIISN
jgi:thioredoxin 1